MIRIAPVIIIVCIIGTSLFAQQKLGLAYFERAQQKISEGDWPAAKDYLNRCLIDVPNYAEGYALRAEVNEKLDKPQDALTDYSIALELLPTLADCYLKRGILAYSLERFDLARSDFRKLLHLRDSETNRVYFRQTNNEHFDKIFTLQSNIRDMLYNYLGLLETKAGNYGDAVLFLDTAIQINPNTPDYYAHRGLAYLQVSDYDKANEDFEQALRLDPNHAISKNNLATLKRRQGRLEEAEQYLKEAKELSPRSADHYGNLAILQYERGIYSQAIHNFDSAIALNPVAGELFINRGLAKEKIQDYSGAFQDFNRALQIDSEWPKAWFVQGNYFMKQHQWQEALENYSTAIAYDENYSFAYYNRAIVYYQLKQYSKACTDLRVAREKGIIPEDNMQEKFCRK